MPTTNAKIAASPSPNVAAFEVCDEVAATLMEALVALVERLDVLADVVLPLLVTV